MKFKILLLLAFSFFSFQVIAQEIRGTSDVLYLGAGGTVNGRGDYFGVVLYSQYTHQLNDTWAVAPRLSFAMGKAGEPFDSNLIGSGLYWQFSAIAIETDINYTPIPKFFNIFSISLSTGPSIRYLIETRPISSWEGLDEENNEKILEAEYRQKASFSLGITFGVNLNIDLSDRFLIGARGTAQAYTDGDIIPFYGLFLGKKLK